MRAARFDGTGEGAGFRLPRNTAPEVVAQFDQTFLVGSQVELYGGAQINADGSVRTFRFFILYQYDEERVRGVFRLLTDSTSDPGGTLLVLQEAGKVFKMYFRDFSTDAKARRIPVEEMAQTIAFTDWHFEDALDDDKTDREFYNHTLGYVDGVECDVVSDRFTDPAIQKHSAYGERRLFFAREDSRYLTTEKYDRGGKLIKAIQAWNHKNVGTPRQAVDSRAIHDCTLLRTGFDHGAIDNQGALQPSPTTRSLFAGIPRQLERGYGSRANSSARGVRC